MYFVVLFYYMQHYLHLHMIYLFNVQYNNYFRWDFSVSEHTVSYVTDSSSPSIPQLSHVESPAVTHGSEDTHPGEDMEYEDPDVKLYACPEDSGELNSDIDF